MVGKFIVFEGLDGSGLSTQASMLKDYLIKKEKRVVLTKEQTTGMIGGLIKSSLKKEWRTSPLALQLLFAADRAHHLKNDIEPALKENKVVVCDRYIFSTLAFGSIGVDMKFLKMINSKFRKPDITFIIDTPVQVCLDRIAKSRFSLELFERRKELELVRKNYLSLRKYFPHVFVVKGDKKEKEVFEDIKKIVDKRI